MNSEEGWEETANRELEINREYELEDTYSVRTCSTSSHILGCRTFLKQAQVELNE